MLHEQIDRNGARGRLPCCRCTTRITESAETASRAPRGSHVPQVQLGQAHGEAGQPESVQWAMAQGGMRTAVDMLASEIQTGLSTLASALTSLHQVRGCSARA